MIKSIVQAINLCLISKVTQIIIHDIMAQQGAKIMPDNWVCKQ